MIKLTTRKHSQNADCQMQTIETESSNLSKIGTLPFLLLITRMFITFPLMSKAAKSSVNANVKPVNAV